MSEWERIVENILAKHGYILTESEQKVNWILSQSKLVQALENRIKSDSKVPDNITAEQLLKDFDNSSIVIRKFLPWVVKMYSKGEFEYTDLGLVSSYLEKFIDNSRKLEKKDINSYKSLNELDKALKDIKDVKGSREAKRDAKSGAEKVYEDDKWVIIVPHTKEAAIQYGKGTKWCTAALNDNMFDYYNSQGSLYIIINKQNPLEKYQFHLESDQYVDTKDKEIDIKSFLEKNQKIYEFIKPKINKANWKTWPTWFMDDLENFDYNDYLNAVKYNPYALQFTPDKFKDYTICLTAAKRIYNRLIEIENDKDNPNYNEDYERISDYFYNTMEEIPEQYQEKIKQELGIR